MAPTWHLHRGKLCSSACLICKIELCKCTKTTRTRRIYSAALFLPPCLHERRRLPFTASPAIQFRSRLRFDEEHAVIGGSGTAPVATGGYSRKRISMSSVSPGSVNLLHSSWKTGFSCHSTARSLTARSFGLQPCDATIRAAHAPDAAVLRCVPAHQHPPQLTAADNVGT